MNHEEAIESNAAAAYLLGDLSREDRDAFEEHFFECALCANDVRNGTAMLSAGHEVVRSEQRVRSFRARGWLHAAAAAVLVIVAYQTVIIPRLQTEPLPQMAIIPQGQLLHGVTRGGGSEYTVRFEGDLPFVIPCEIPSDHAYPSYRFAFIDASKKPMHVITAAASEVLTSEGEPVPLLLRRLPAGRYELVIEGVGADGNRVAIVSHQIVVH